MGYTRRDRWNDEKIISGVLEVKDFLGLSRMPTRRECKEYFRNAKLTNAVARRDGGWYRLAEELHLPIKDSETTFGKKYEAKAAILLEGQGFEVRRMTQNFPYDLLLNNSVKVDVKASKKYCGSLGDFYSYNLEKSAPTCDFYLLFAVSDEGDIIKTMVIPSSEVSANTQISIGAGQSKYYQYENRFDLLHKAASFWQDLMVS